jgi:hypothetical protein
MDVTSTVQSTRGDELKLTLLIYSGHMERDLAAQQTLAEP